MKVITVDKLKYFKKKYDDILSPKLEKLSDGINQLINKDKRINAINIGCDNTGNTSCTDIIKKYLKPNTVLYFPKGTYKCNINALENITIMGDGNLSVLKQDEPIDIITITEDSNAQHVVISDLKIVGDSNYSLGDGINLNGKKSNVNYLHLNNVTIENINGCGISVKGLNVENVFTNVYINECKGIGIYNEGHDTFFNNIKIGRTQKEILINKGNNLNCINFHTMYGYKADQHAIKSKDSNHYSIINYGSYCNFDNMQIGDNYQNGILFSNCNNVTFNGIVDAMGIITDDSNWTSIHSPNNDCIGIDIVNSNVTFNAYVNNWHGDKNGFYRIDDSSILNGNIYNCNKYNISEPILNSPNVVTSDKLINDMFENTSRLLNKLTFTWGPNQKTYIDQTKLPTVQGSRYGVGLFFTGGACAKINTSEYITGDNFEISLTVQPHDTPVNISTIFSLENDTNTLKLVYDTNNNVYLNINYKSDSSKNINQLVGNFQLNQPNRIFLKVYGESIGIRCYKYNLMFIDEKYIIPPLNMDNSTLFIAKGNMSAIYNDLVISKCIPDMLDFKKYDCVIDTTPYTTFREPLTNV